MWFWKIILYSNKSQEFVSNEVGYFELSLLEQTDWLANWIGFPAGRNGKKHYILETHMKFNQIYLNHVHIFVELDVMDLGLMEEKLEIVF